MKNKLIAVAFMLLMNHIIMGQNFVNDGGFEQGNDCVDNVSFNDCWSSLNSCSSSGGCSLNYNWRSYYNTCPGGYSAVNLKMKYWEGQCDVSPVVGLVTLPLIVREKFPQYLNFIRDKP